MDIHIPERTEMKINPTESKEKKKYDWWPTKVTEAGAEDRMTLFNEFIVKAESFGWNVDQENTTMLWSAWKIVVWPKMK